MKIKSFLYNQETEEAISLAFSSVSCIAKKLGIKLRPEKDFRQRMDYAIQRARNNRWGTNPREITSIKISVGVSYHSPWSSATHELMEYSISRELVDADVTDIGLCGELGKYAGSVKIVISVNHYQAWRRQARKKPAQSVAALKEVLSGPRT